MIEMLEAPADLDRLARAAWEAGYTATIARTEWLAIYEVMLRLMASSASIYVQLVRAWQDAGVAPAPEDAAGIECSRVIARKCAAEFWLIERNRIEERELRADGLDRDLAAICGLPPVAVQ
jgi:hypothetical protein